MSTAIEIERIPASFSRVAIQAGVGALASIPSTASSAKPVQPGLPWIGEESLTLRAKPCPASGFHREAGSLNFFPVACEYSRAIPLIERQ